MKNNKYKTHDVKNKCEKKLGIEFRSNGELNGWFIFNGRKTARITVPKGKKFIPPKTYKSMAFQLKLTVDEFDLFLDCPLTKEKYLQILKDRMQ